MSNVMMLIVVGEVTPPYPASEERADYCQIICQYITRLSILRIRCLERRASPCQYFILILHLISIVVLNQLTATTGNHSIYTPLYLVCVLCQSY